jgi:hypothetical protein
VPASDVIDSGGIDLWVSSYRHCQDRLGYADCRGYANGRLQAAFPQESQASINAVITQASAARDAGNAANQSGPGRTIRPGGGYDPADIQRRAGNQSAFRYRYSVMVSYQIVGGGKSGENFSYRVFIDSRSPLTAGEIRSQALDEVAAFARMLEREYDRLAGGDVTGNYTVRIESAYRDRA